jgi:predicted DCC family thiol-disulfide oxidoreductase YuxK
MNVPVVRFVVKGQPEETTLGSGRPYTVVYDGTCKVCGKLVRLLNAWDTHHVVETIQSQHAGVPARFPWIPANAYRQAVQLIGPGGRTWSGAAAIEELLDILPKGWLFGWLFKIPGVRVIADRFYKWFARNRYKFGCGEHCQLHEPMVDFGDEPAASAHSR